MLRLLKKLRRNERGNVLMMTALAMPLLVGSAGLAVDTIQWALWKRQLQRAADSAALAGVYARVQANAGQTAVQAVNADLVQNNHVSVPLQSGFPVVTNPTAPNWTNGVRVELAVSRNLGFSSMFLSTPPVIRATATAATIATGVYCVVSLEPTSATGITATGNGSIDLGCGMITNSTSLSAAIATGSSEVNASPVAAVGNVRPSENWNGAELLPFTIRQEDPYGDVNIPAFTGCQGAASRFRVGSNETLDVSAAHTALGTVCVSEMTLAGNVTLGRATYIIDGGNFSVGSQARVTCDGCTIVLTNSSGSPTATIGNVDMNGGARINMSAPDSGNFSNILFYQDRRAAPGTSQVNRINGNSASLFEGAFYFPTRQMQVNGTAGLNFECAHFVARTVEFSGNGSITNNCDDPPEDERIMGRHVRLVS